MYEFFFVVVVVVFSFFPYRALQIGLIVSGFSFFLLAAFRSILSLLLVLMSCCFLLDVRQQYARHPAEFELVFLVPALSFE